MTKLNGNRYVVTGGAGFIGSHIAEEIVRQGKQVVVVDNLISGNIDNFSGWWDDRLCTFVEKGVESADEWASLMLNAKAVFHNAASKCTVCRVDPFSDLIVNAWGSWCVFNSANTKKVKIIHASTGSVYGDTGSVITEDMSNFAPKSFYGVSKLAAESYLRAMSEYDTLCRYTILRYYHVYGTRQNDSDLGGVIPIFTRRVYEGKPIIVYGNGDQVRSFTHINDVVEANIRCANMSSTDNDDFNCASGIQVTINQLANMVQHIMGRRVEVIHEEVRGGDIKDFNIDNSKIRERTHMEFKTDFESELVKIIDWYVNKWGSKCQG